MDTDLPDDFWLSSKLIVLSLSRGGVYHVFNSSRTLYFMLLNLKDGSFWYCFSNYVMCIRWNFWGFAFWMVILVILGVAANTRLITTLPCFFLCFLILNFSFSTLRCGGKVIGWILDFFKHSDWLPLRTQHNLYLFFWSCSNWKLSVRSVSAKASCTRWGFSHWRFFGGFYELRTMQTKIWMPWIDYMTSDIHALCLILFWLTPIVWNKKSLKMQLYIYVELVLQDCLYCIAQLWRFRTNLAFKIVSLTFQVAHFISLLFRVK